MAENKNQNCNKMEENLTKENFWNDLYERYSEEMKVFCNWIDEYKKRVNWSFLFGDDQYKTEASKIKYHHLPLAMQIGIFLQFVHENNKETEQTIYIVPPYSKKEFSDFDEAIKNYFKNWVAQKEAGL